MSRAPEKKQGVLTKQGGFRKTWKQRLFVCDYENHCLDYYSKKKIDAGINKVKGKISLIDAVITPVEEKKFGKKFCFCITIKRNARAYPLVAANRAEYDDWLRTLTSMAQAASKISANKWEKGTACEGCGLDFTITRRRHHCRSCGHSFCDECSANTAVVTTDDGETKEGRVCDACSDRLGGTRTPRGRMSVFSKPGADAKSDAKSDASSSGGSSSTSGRDARDARASVSASSAPPAASAAAAASPRSPDSSGSSSVASSAASSAASSRAASRRNSAAASSPAAPAPAPERERERDREREREREPASRGAARSISGRRALEEMGDRGDPRDAVSPTSGSTSRTTSRAKAAAAPPPRRDDSDNENDSDDDVKLEPTPPPPKRKGKGGGGDSAALRESLLSDDDYPPPKPKKGSSPAAASASSAAAADDDGPSETTGRPVAVSVSFQPRAHLHEEKSGCCCVIQ